MQPHNVLGPGPAPRSRRKIVTVIVVASVVGVVVVLLAVLYGVRMFVIAIGVETDVPPASVVSLPTGSELLRETSDCASGGCWTILTVQPADGQTPESLAEEMGVTSQLEIPGNFLDPRTVWVEATPRGPVLTLTLDYYHSEG